MQSSRKTAQAEEMQALLAEHAKSELSLAAFARQRGIHPRTLYYWSRRLRSSAAAAKTAPRLAPVTLIHDRPGAPRIEVELRSGHRVHLPTGYDPAELSRLIGVLESC